jgi:hypothetical protein
LTVRPDPASHDNGLSKDERCRSRFGLQPREDKINDFLNCPGDEIRVNLNMNLPKKMKRTIGLSAALIWFAASQCRHPIKPETAAHPMTLPVEYSRVKSIWPFGVKGGDHPEGHPGIDFEADTGTPILAAAAGMVTWIGNSVYPGEKSITVHNGDYDTYYTGYFTTVKVSAGAQVIQGQTLAEMDLWPGTKAGFPHFGVNRSGTDLCPYDVMDDSSKAQLIELLNKSDYPEKGKYPLICN